MNRRWTKENVLEEIKKLTDPSAKSAQRTIPSLYGAAVRYFGGWKSAIEAAGFEYSSVTKRRTPGWWTHAKVIEEISQCSEKSSGFVRKNRSDLYSAALRLYGSWKTAVQAAGLNYESVTKRRVRKTPVNHD